MTNRLYVLIAGALLQTLFVSSAALAMQAVEEDTIKSLEGREVEVRPGRMVLGDSNLARDNYRAFLELASDDPELRSEAMRRLGDLELEASEADQLADNLETLDLSGFSTAVNMYQQLLQSYPDYDRNDAVLYQLARAYEVSGQTDEALEVLDDLVARYPDTQIIDEVQFRRGEMLFLRKRYNDAELAYQVVNRYGEQSRYYEQSLYKLGWSQFKLSWYEESLTPFFELLDRKIDGVDIGEDEERLASLKRAERELVEDTFRVLSIGFSYMDGTQAIDDALLKHGNPEYGYVIYRNLGDLYLEQERYQDAAITYEAFVQRDPTHAKAPLMQVDAIEAYKQGGFPSLVLEGKKDYVERYASDSEFWASNTSPENAAVAENLKSSLTDLAQYYHSEAQKDGEASDYQEASKWYRQYLDQFPDAEDSASSNFLLAEILFESGEFAAATTEYQRTAYDYPPHEQSAEAGYATILAFREHEETLQGAAKDEWHTRYIGSGLRFAESFPQHPESGAVLTTVAEDLFAQDEFSQAITVGEAVVAKQPAVSDELSRTAWTVIAHSNFDLDNFFEAENSYYRLRDYTPNSDREANQEIDERIASSIYKQGEQARDRGDLETAVTHFTRLGQVVPNSDIRATAEYDAAAALINMEDWGRASTVLEQFRADYPDSEFAEDVTQKLAVSYLESGNDGRAASEFERIAVADSSTEDVRREALWRASELYGESGAINDEQRVLSNIVSRYPNPLSESIEARFRLLEIDREIGTQSDVNTRLQEFVRLDANAGAQRSDRSRYLAAKATLELADPVRRRFQAAKFSQPLAESLQVKKSLMEDVIAAYTGAADYGVAEVTTAATYRLGEVYQQFSSDLMSSERPAALEADALEQYEILLEEQAFPFEERAIELFEANAGRTADGVYDEWVESSFERLASLMPARYAKKERSEDVVTSPQ